MKDFTLNLSGGLFSLILAAAVASWQTIVVVTVVYALLLFGNLVTGLLYANQTDSYSKEKAKKAVYKKGGVITGIMVIFVLDLLIMGMTKSAGIPYNLPYLGSLFAGYSATHEFISMLQNIKKLGNKIPKVVEGAAQKAEAALDQGKIPDITEILKN